MSFLCTERLDHDRQIADVDPVIFADPRVFDNLMSSQYLYVPHINYFEKVQLDLHAYMRGIVVIWMLEVCEEQNCESQVYPLAVNYLDRFLCTCPIARGQLQLAAAACLLIASKARQCTSFNIPLMCFYTEHSISNSQLRDWEILVLAKINWNLASVTVCDFINHIIERCIYGQCKKQIRNHAHVLSGLALSHNYFIFLPSSVTATATIVAALRGLKKPLELEDMVYSMTRAPKEEVEDGVVIIEILVQAQAEGRLNISGMMRLMGPIPNPTAPPGKVKHPPQQQEITNDSGKPNTPKEVEDIHF